MLRRSLFAGQLAFTLLVAAFLIVPAVLSMLAGVTVNYFQGIRSGVTLEWMVQVWDLYADTIFRSFEVAFATPLLTLSLGEFNLTWMLHTPLTKTLPVGLADSYASMRLEIASAYTLIFFIMIIPLLIAIQMLGRGKRSAA